MKTVARIVLAAFAASVLYATTAIASMSAHAADAPATSGAVVVEPVKSDYQAKLELIEGQLVAQQERESALLAGCNTIAASLLGAIASCGADSLCKVMLAQEVGKLKCAGGGGAAAASAPASVAIPDPPPPPVPWYERFFTFGGRVIEKTLDQVPALAQLKLGMVQSNNATALGIRQSDNQLGATQSTNAAFVSMNNGTVAVARAGFRSNVRIASDAFGAATNIAASGNQVAAAYASRATTQITTGNGSSVTIGTGNVVNTQNGTENRQTSPGPCTSTTGTQTPTTGSPAASSAAPCTVN